MQRNRRSAGGGINANLTEFGQVYRNFQILENVGQNLRAQNAITDVQLNTIVSWSRKQLVGNVSIPAASTAPIAGNVVPITTRTRRSRSRSRNVGTGQTTGAANKRTA